MCAQSIQTVNPRTDGAPESYAMMRGEVGKLLSGSRYEVGPREFVNVQSITVAT